MISKLSYLWTGKPDRVGALRRFAVTQSVLTLLGHLVLGFEMSYAVPIVALLVAYATSLALEWTRAQSSDVTPAYAGGTRKFIEFLLPAHIIGITCAAFLYPGSRLMPVVFATVFAVCSRTLFRVKDGQGHSRHILNPSNVGLLATLVCFPAVSIFLPYQFSSQVGDAVDVALPLVLFALGGFVNARFAKRIPLVAGWLVAFVGQALLRALFLGEMPLATLGPATGAAAIIFTFFMVTDPGTTPEKPLRQLAFGTAVGLLYGVLTVAHAVYALFWALALVSTARGILIAVEARRTGGNAQTPREPVEGEGWSHGSAA